MELIIRKCMKCGATVEVLKDCTCDNCGIKCCGEQMVIEVPNTVEASHEKHIPQVEIFDRYIVVSVNHVMDEDHYISGIALETDKTIGKKYFKPGEQPKAIFPYVPGSKVYAYCNLHGLWSADVK